MYTPMRSAPVPAPRATQPRRAITGPVLDVTGDPDRLGPAVDHFAEERLDAVPPGDVPLGEEVRMEEDPVVEHLEDDALHIPRGHERAAGEERRGLRRAQELDPGPRRRPDQDPRVLPGAPDELHHEVEDLRGHPDRERLLPEPVERARVEPEADGLGDGGLAVPLEERPFVGLARVPHQDPEEEAVELGLRGAGTSPPARSGSRSRSR